MQPLKTNPIPSVTVTRPAADLDAAFKTLFDIVGALPPLMECQFAYKYIANANFWIHQALIAVEKNKEKQEEFKKMMEAKQAEAKKAAENKIVTP